MAKKKNKSDNKTAPTGPRTVASNRKARHDYHIEERFEAGISLTGTEIKSVRDGQVQLREGFVLIRDNEAWLTNVHIAHYAQGNINNHQETRRRKLLLHRKEIEKLHTQVTMRQWTIVPLRMYITERGLAKVEIALVQGKQSADKRQDIAKRDAKRDVERAIKQSRY